MSSRYPHYKGSAYASPHRSTTHRSLHSRLTLAAPRTRIRTGFNCKDSQRSPGVNHVHSRMSDGRVVSAHPHACRTRLHCGNRNSLVAERHFAYPLRPGLSKSRSAMRRNVRAGSIRGNGSYRERLQSDVRTGEGPQIK